MDGESLLLCGHVLSLALADQAERSGHGGMRFVFDQPVLVAPVEWWQHMPWVKTMGDKLDQWRKD